MINFFNFGSIDPQWRLDVITDICTKVLAYADSHELKDVILVSVEDSIWSDPDNQRYDIVIRYINSDNYLIDQKLLMLKGEVIDGKTFHKRYSEFYPNRKVGK